MSTSLPGLGSTFTVEAYTSRESWLTARLRGLGGSDAPALWREEIEAGGETVRSSPYSLFFEKRGAVTDEPEDTAALRMGERFEPVIADMHAEDTGLAHVYPGPFVVLRSLAWPWMHVSPDRLIPESSAGPGGLECKWAAWEDWSESPPLRAQAQAQHAMAVTGYGWWDVAGIVRGRFCWARVQRDAAWIGLHVDACRALWEAIVKGEEPEADEHEATGRTLRRLYARADAGTAALPVGGDFWLDVWTNAKADIKAADVRRKRAENRLRAMIGYATHATTPSGRTLRLAVERESGARVLRETSTRRK